MDYFHGFAVRLVVELTAVEALLAEDTAERRDIRELWRPGKDKQNWMRMYG